MRGFAPDQVAFYLGDPHGAFRRVRAEDPLHWYAAGPFWCATRHAEVCEIGRRPRTFSSAHGTQLFEIPLRLQGTSYTPEIADMAPSIIQMDPPAHNRHRKLVMSAFTPRMVAALEPRIRALARESVASIRPGCHSISWRRWRFRCRCSSSRSCSGCRARITRRSGAGPTC